MSGHDDPRSSPAPDDRGRDPDRPSRRVRVDGRPAPWVERPPKPAPGAEPPPAYPPDGGVSGKLVVMVIVLGVMVVWGGLNLAFRVWRSSYRERAAYGVSRVAEAITPLAEVLPSGEAPGAAHAAAVAGLAAPVAAVAPVEVDPADWRRAVADTRALLVTLTASNLLDRAQMDAIGTAIEARVARASARPATARAELAELWDEIGRDAGPNVSRRHRRPRLLPPPAPVPPRVEAPPSRPKI